MTQINTSELDNAIQELGSSLSNIINRALTVEDMRMQALTSVEVSQLYNGGVQRDLLKYTPLPAHYWRYELAAGDNATTVQDIGNTGGKNITLTNVEIEDYVNDTP